MTKLVDLHRTFSEAKELTDQREKWEWHFVRQTDRLTWLKLHDNTVTVVVGEAGIGKTIEFRNEVTRLRAQGKAAFFVELNQLVTRGDWECLLEVSGPAYVEWMKSSDVGYFFLDAVDEARLTSHTNFKRALSIAHTGLRPNLARVRVAISSRWTDWSLDEVQSIISELLVQPIESARLSKQVPPDAEHQSTTFVVSLDPLSLAEAKRFAINIGVEEGDLFWKAVNDGQYEYMASRPLDLEWLVTVWNTDRTFSTYQILLDRNVDNRLTETNPNYQAANALLSPDKLREGAEDLAAAAEFSGRHYIAVALRTTSRNDELTPMEVLTEWTSTEVMRLLASAVFDEATYGRVKFHHRSVREYLAACWVDRQLNCGVPFQNVLQLFAAEPFEAMVLIPSRRWVLSWLAAINVKAREWVTYNYPEIFTFDGDPEAWDPISAEQAFTAYLQRQAQGLRIDWYNDASEFRRVCRRLRSDLIVTILADASQPEHVKTTLLPYVKHGRLSNCAEVIFSIYQNITTAPRQRLNALYVLETIATPGHMKAIEKDLLSGAYTTNEFTAAALRVVDWGSFRVEQLIEIFESTGKEDNYGLGPMMRAIKNDLLPVCNAESAELLLTAVLHTLPHPEPGKRFSKIPRSDQPERAWLLSALPHCYERLLVLLSEDKEMYPEIYLDVPLRIEALGSTGFINRDHLHRLRYLVSQRHNLRWQIAFKIASSGEIRHTINRMISLSQQCIVNFCGNDLRELTLRANTESKTARERFVWFTIALNVISFELKGARRTAALEELTVGPEQEERRAKIQANHKVRKKNICENRKYATEERKERKEKREIQERRRIRFLTCIDHIRDASDESALRELLEYSYSHANDQNLFHVDLKLIEKDFSKDTAEALGVGLKAVWKTFNEPKSTARLHSALPWEALYLIAGLYVLLESELDLDFLNPDGVARAVRLAIWELDGPYPWFECLVKNKPVEVCDALQPWLSEELLMFNDESRFQRTVDLVLKCSREARSILLKPLKALVQDQRAKKSKVLQRVVVAMFEDGLLSKPEFSELCRKQLVQVLNTDGLLRKEPWLQTWFKKDTTASLEWFVDYLEKVIDLADDKELDSLATTFLDMKWSQIDGNRKIVSSLLQIFALFSSKAPPVVKSTTDVDQLDTFGHQILRIIDAIPEILVQIPGIAAHTALIQLSEKNLKEKSWLLTQVDMHSSLEAQKSASLEPRQLRDIGSIFQTAPKSESQLFQQVISRLGEIRIGVEEGPFSDRDLFSAGMPEKHLQRWLAARLRDTQNRSFSVHREEEVDDDKKTDIQLSCTHGNVCIEVKPVDRNRSYTATSLTDTLRTQLVGQYLKGYNSGNGILLLFRLDDKHWNIPNGPKKQQFSALVDYLQQQADVIRTESKEVESLLVVGIDCTTRRKLNLISRERR